MTHPDPYWPPLSEKTTTDKPWRDKMTEALPDARERAEQKVIRRHVTAHCRHNFGHTPTPRRVDAGCERASYADYVGDIDG